MKRKVIKQGHNTLTITLPRKWCTAHNVKGGDEVDLAERNKALIINGEQHPIERSTTINVSGLDATTLYIYIETLYRYGYDRIEIKSNATTIPHYRTNRNISLSSIVYLTTNRLVGAEVIQASQNKFIIKQLATDSIKDFPTMLRRVFLLLNEMMESFIVACKTSDEEGLVSIEFQHSNLRKFVNACLRLLNKFGYEDSFKTCYYFHIISLLAKAENIMDNQARFILKHGKVLNNKNFIELLCDVQQGYRAFYEVFYSFDLKKVSTIEKHREMVKAKVLQYKPKMTRCEVLVIGGVLQILELILDMIETRIGLEH